MGRLGGGKLLFDGYSHCRLASFALRRHIHCFTRVERRCIRKHPTTARELESGGIGLRFHQEVTDY